MDNGLGITKGRKKYFIIKKLWDYGTGRVVQTLAQVSLFSIQEKNPVKRYKFYFRISFYAAKLSARRLCQFIPLPPPGQYQYINI